MAQSRVGTAGAHPGFAQGADVELALRMNGISKRYGATAALNSVSFDVPKGNTHAIIGENGAGKSTLIKILSGLELDDAGTMVLNGGLYCPRNLQDSRRAGVSTAFQDLSLLPNLTVAENLFLPRLGDRRPFVRRNANEASAGALLAQHGLSHIVPSQEVGTLALADKQKLEIVRAVSHRPKLLLLDEPSAALPDVDWLYTLLSKISSPDMTVLYISHRLNEIRDLCQTATVLRNGNVVDTVRVSDVDDAMVFGMMGGATQGHGSQTRSTRTITGPPAIVVQGLQGTSVTNVSFSLKRGEILGVAALEGQGQAETFRILAGVAHPTGGTIEVDGRVMKLRSPVAALRNGISFVAEERKTEGIFPGLSTLANVTIAALGKAGRAGFVGGRKELSSTLRSAAEVDLSARYLRMDIDALSGGNQQKAVLARSLMQGSRYLLLYDPSRGVDVGTKGSIYALMEKLVGTGGGGGAILWYSTDLAELTAVCDRILCFYNGTVVAEVSGKTGTVSDLLAAITGQSRQSQAVTK